MELSERDSQVLRELEEELWREATRFDGARMNELLAPDFFEFGRSGRFYAREDTLGAEREPIVAVLPLPDWSARLLDENVAQVTYRSAVTYDGVTEYARRSSIWTRADASWVLRFHQGTPTSIF